MDIEEIKTKVRANEYMYSQHADLERKSDDLTLAQVEDALLTGEMLELCPDTIYIPGPPQFIDPRT